MAATAIRSGDNSRGGDIQARDPGPETPLLRIRELTKVYGPATGCRDISLDIWPGEVVAIVGESASGKTTVLNCLSGQVRPDTGSVGYRRPGRAAVDIHRIGERERRALQSEWGFVHQEPRDGLRMGVSAGGNIGEPLMMGGARHFGRIRATALDWLDRVELDRHRIDDLPATFSAGMLKRLQIARALVSEPRLAFLDEPTAGLDVSVKACIVDLLRRLVGGSGLSALIVTRDLAVARLLAQRILVMQAGTVVESGLTDQVLDDPQEAYTQALVSALLPV